MFIQVPFVISVQKVIFFCKNCLITKYGSKWVVKKTS